MKRITLYMGHYGSGKTEISLNEALALADRGIPATLVDLDIVNPYFRSGEQRRRLEEAGVRVLAPIFEGTTVDVPALPPEVQSVFADRGRRVIFDVGGDPGGAAALGRYKPYFDREAAQVLCVVNTCRPFTGDVGGIVDMVRALEARSRLPVAGLIHNSNLAALTRPAVLIEGQPVVEAAAQALGIPVRAIYAMPRILAELHPDFRQRYGPLLRPLTPYMRPDWMDDGGGG